MVYRIGGAIDNIYGPGDNNEPTLTVETIPSGLEIGYRSNMAGTFLYPDPNNGKWRASYEIEIVDPDIAEQIEGYIFTLSATGYESITFNSDDGDLEIEELTMTPSNSVSVLSDGTNSYAIKDSQARSDIASLQTSKVPTTRTVNGKALSSDITLTASDVGALPDSTVIPTVNNATLTIQKNGTTVNTFTANASSNATANITVPTDTNDLTNGAGFITSSDISNMVTTNTNQTITGKKVLAGKDKTMLSNENVTKGTNPSSTQYINFGLFGDTTSSYTDRLGCMETSIDSSGNVITYLRAYKNEASSSTAGNITVNYPASGSPYATAPTPTEDTNNSVQIDTVGARNTKLADYALDSTAVKTTGNQTIGGTKTFTNSPIFNMQCYTAYNGASNTNQYKKIATGIKTGANTSFVIPFMFYASHVTTSSGTYNGKISCRTGSTAGSATVSSSGIVLNGNPDFISNGNIVFYLMYKNNYPESNQVTFEVWVYVKNTYQGVNIIPMRIGTGSIGQDISAVTWGNNMTEANALPSGFTAINQIIL